MTRRGWWLFAAVAVLWGIPYLFIRVAVQADLAPTVVVWVRTGGAALLLLPVAVRGRALRGLLPRWRTVLALTAVQITAPFLLITAGERTVTSSLAGLLVAAEPLFVVLLIAALTRTGRWRAGAEDGVGRRQVLGLLVGFGGVVALLGIDLGGPAALPGAAMVLAAALLYAVGALVIRRVGGDIRPTALIAAVLVLNTLVLTPFALPALPDRVPPAPVVGSLVALAVLCTAAAFVTYFALIREVGPARATVVFYVTPVVTVAVGALVLGEVIGLGTVAGLLLVVTGSWLATSRR